MMTVLGVLAVVGVAAWQWSRLIAEDARRREWMAYVVWADVLAGHPMAMFVAMRDVGLTWPELLAAARHHEAGTTPPVADRPRWRRRRLPRARIVRG